MYILPLCKGQILWSLQYHGNTILPLKEDNLSITVKSCQKLLVPKCPLFRGSTVAQYKFVFAVQYYG